MTETPPNPQKKKTQTKTRTKQKPKRKIENKMVLITVLMPPLYIEEMDKLVKKGFFHTRSEVIRSSCRDTLKQYWTTRTI